MRPPHVMTPTPDSTRAPFLAALLALLAGAHAAHGDDWPQWQGPRRDGVWRESGIVERLPKDGQSASPAFADRSIFVHNGRHLLRARLSPS